MEFTRHCLAGFLAPAVKIGWWMSDTTEHYRLNHGKMNAAVQRAILKVSILFGVLQTTFAVI